MIFIDLKIFHAFLLFSLFSLIPVTHADAASNPNLFVSAENPQFNNRFSGSMVVEVVIRDSNLQDTDEGKGEPDVTINGKTLRMVQATDGNWYAYFANVDKAKIADSTVGLPGKGLDFGVFCSRNTATSVFGISLSETDGFSIPRDSGISGFTNGNTGFSQCTGSLSSGANLNNVVRNAKSINTNPNIPSGQIGLDSDAWPLIQLFSFDDVTVQYNRGGGIQSVDLEYDESDNISIKIDRERYPENSEVFLTLTDFQLNQDPTDEDSWTFNIDSNSATFYQAFDSNGANSANGGAGLVNLNSFLSSLGFEDNGKLFLDLGSIMKLDVNSEQPTNSITNGVNSFSQIITLVEDGPNSGIFDSADDNDDSILQILDNAPRGQTGRIEYDRKSLSVLTGFSTASVSIGEPQLTIVSSTQQLNPGTKYKLSLIDPDQNINSGARDHLDVFRDSALLPSLQIGNPITLQNAFDFQFFSLSADPLTTGDDANSSLPDTNSDILHIDTSNVANGSFEKISFNLGLSASELNSVLIDQSTSGIDGTNWLNYDFRSFEKDFGLTDFSNTSIQLSFGSLGSSPVTLVDAGDLSSSQGFFQLDDDDIQSISSKSGTVFVVIDFGSSGIISNEPNNQPVVFDFFSFGIEDDGTTINNAIYRFELEETSDNSSEFTGTIEYAVTNQLNILDSDFIQTIRPIDDQVKFIVTDRLIDDEGISVSYSDLDQVGITTITSTKSDIFTNSGTVYASSSSFRFGQPVTLTLNDPDLNLKNDVVDIYFVIDDPNSPYVDTVGKDGTVLLEVLIKDIRYKRCTVDGVEHGGLADTGFTLVETSPNSGVFTGVFKMPSKICDKSGTKLISTAGGSLDAKYHDSRDSSGNSNIFSLLRSKSTTSFSSNPVLSSTSVQKPISGNIEEIFLSGSLTNHKRGVPLTITLTGPDGIIQDFAATLSSGGGYRTVFSINENSLTGTYKIILSHSGVNVGTVSFVVHDPHIPDWVKNNARWWSSSTVSDSEFAESLEHLIDEGIISISPTERNSSTERSIPDWVKNNARWWSDNKISDSDFIKSIQYLVKKGIIRV
ncbi:peptidase [Nitrosopumilus sp. K4]|uniref:peptidase n=1 Tax=Nitrosopumilus sp. K4 TaxID=2795383 RepID=UPI001BA7877D|nr:peptidase [Nitrosopumilus sp. K4]QUC64205.1 peptidase [Nitrosopumilus sp. K4]